MLSLRECANFFQHPWTPTIHGNLKVLIPRNMVEITFEMFGFCLLLFVAFLFLVAQDTMGLCDTLCFLWQLSHKFRLVILAVY